MSGATQSRSSTWPGPAWGSGPSWRRRWPGGVGLIDADWIGLSPDAGGLAPHQSPAVEWLDPDEVAQLVPGLALPMAGALIRHQARVNPLRAVARLSAVLPGVATGVAATGVSVQGGRVIAVQTTAGLVQPGAVVFATGLPPVLDGLELEVPWERVKGHLLVTEPAPVQLPGIVAPVATQLEDGRLLVGGTFDTGDESPVLRPEVIDSILAGLTAMLPELRRECCGGRWLYTASSCPAIFSAPAPGPGHCAVRNI